MEVDFERVYWKGVDDNSKLALQAIRDLIEYLEGVKKELCLRSTELTVDSTVKLLGPATEVAVTGLVHAIHYLSVCRDGINETDLTIAKRALIRLDLK